jgi:hypothetical protein
MVSKTPGFTRITRRKVSANGIQAEWREWRDAEHLQSDTLITFPVRNGEVAQTQEVSVGIVANSEERRRALEDHLMRTTVLNPNLGTLSPILTAAIARLHFDYSRWTVLDVTPNGVKWLNEKNDEVSVELVPRATNPVPLSDESELRNFWREEAKRHHGGIVAADLQPAKVGQPSCATMIAKYPLRSIAGWAYQAVAVVPRADDVIKLEIRSRETGTTGAREAVAMIVLAAKAGGKVDIASSAKGFTKDPYDAKFDGEAQYMLSDDPKFDAGLPQHPLTKCRAALRTYLGVAAP